MESLYRKIVTGILQKNEYSVTAGNRVLQLEKAKKEKEIELCGENHYNTMVHVLMRHVSRKTELGQLLNIRSFTMTEASIYFQVSFLQLNLERHSDYTSK